MRRLAYQFNVFRADFLQFGLCFIGFRGHQLGVIDNARAIGLRVAQANHAGRVI